MNYFEDWETDEGYEHEDDWDDDRDEGCCLGDECLNPHYNHRSFECYDLAMAEEWSNHILPPKENGPS